jgi:hypothetical protein
MVTEERIFQHVSNEPKAARCVADFMIKVGLLGQFQTMKPLQEDLRWMRYSDLTDWESGSEPRMTRGEDSQYCRMMETGSEDTMTTTRINIPTRKGG